MPFIFQKYDTVKIERLHKHILDMAGLGQPLYYEIQVDGIRAVPKTNDPDLFETHENYVSEDSKAITIIIYDGSSKRNNRHVFYVHAESDQIAVESGLNGTNLDNTFSRKDIERIRRDKEKNLNNLLKKEEYEKQISDLKNDMQEADKKHKTEISEKDQHIAALEDGIVKLKEHYHHQGYELGDILSGTINSLIKNNPATVAKIPIVGDLAGFFGSNESPNGQAPDEKKEDAEVKFSKSGAASQSDPEQKSALDEIGLNEAGFLKLLQNFKQHFTKEEFTQVVEIIARLSEDKSSLEALLQWLDSKEQNDSNINA